MVAYAWRAAMPQVRDGAVILLLLLTFGARFVPFEEVRQCGLVCAPDADRETVNAWQGITGMVGALATGAFAIVAVVVPWPAARVIGQFASGLAGLVLLPSAGKDLFDEHDRYLAGFWLLLMLQLAILGVAVYGVARTSWRRIEGPPAPVERDARVAAVRGKT